MKMVRTVFLCMVSTLVSEIAAHASVITNSVVIDLSHASIDNDSSGGQSIFGYGATLVPVPSFKPQIGDTLVTTVTFADGARLKIIDGRNTIDSNGPDYFEGLTFYFNDVNNEFHESNTTNVVFSDLEGNLTDPTPGGFSQGVLAQSLSPDFTDSYTSFSGLTMTTTIVSLPRSGVQSYDHFGLFGGRAGGFEVIGATATPVPEPASIVVWCFGLISAGLGVRLERKFASIAS